MNLSRFALFLLSLSFMWLGPLTSASAATKAPAPPPDDRKLVKSVDVKASSVVVQNMRDKTVHTYKIDALTVLKVNNQPGQVDQLKPGMVVDDYQERYSDTLDSLSVSGYGTVAPAKPKSKTPAKPKPPAQT